MAKLPRVTRGGYHLLGGERGQVLLVHGYTGSPYDVRPLADFLAHQGFLVHGLLLKGHGKKSSDLFQVNKNDWLLQAEDALNAFDPQKPIILGGLSMGALVAIVLAAHYKNITGLLLLSPALRLSLFAEMTILSSLLGILNKNTALKKLFGESDILDPQARRKTPAYKDIPINGLVQFHRLRNDALKLIHQVDCPIFAAFGNLDGTINIAESYRLLMEKTLQPVFSKFYDKSKHIITLDYNREELMHDVVDFIVHRLRI